ncbi:hypothetical protein OESDEN_03992 [Oesophagostomum dentatum]|uniref:Uncharacterized protein n=1 Tax=Oesophagostomum dentatum TaxID=61180 RepID=A0A0B1TFL5_OESDE|nr:hypothetical protein OESDEN_03992 [Oesophagostomum dentatum]
MITKVKIFGRYWPALLDGSSEISILPARVLLRAKGDGYDIDNKVKELMIDQSTKVYDASGCVMSFLTIVEAGEVTTPVYIAKVEDDLVILGTNTLHRTRYQFRKESEPKKATSVGNQSGEDNPRTGELKMATVKKSEFVALGAVKWVSLTGCKGQSNWMLESSSEMIPSGVLHTDKNGLAEIPVINRSEEAVN